MVRADGEKAYVLTVFKYTFIHFSQVSFVVNDLSFKRIVFLAVLLKYNVVTHKIKKTPTK
jgi:hypothetical protein